MALREEESGGEKPGGGIGFHQQESALAAPSVLFRVSPGQQNCVFKMGIEGIIGTGEGKQSQSGFFSRFLDFSSLPCCSVSVVPLCCGEQEMLSWRLYLMGGNVN